MGQESPAFFPLRSRRVALDDRIASFPFPQTITYARLQDELDVFPDLVVSSSIRGLARARR
jgi:hypothetical protein